MICGIITVLLLLSILTLKMVSRKVKITNVAHVRFLVDNSNVILRTELNLTSPGFLSDFPVCVETFFVLTDIP